MDKRVVELELTSFGEFLLKRSLVPAEKEKFYVMWLRRYLKEPDQLAGQDWEEKLMLFLEMLGGDSRYAPWQLNQAENAVRLYYKNFRPLRSSISPPSESAGEHSEERWVDESGTLNKLSRSLRLKHYAFKTEKSYMAWCKRLFSYSFEHHGKNEQACLLISPSVITDFLARLATRDKVAKSTQNQAFSAIFFFAELFWILIFPVWKRMSGQVAVKNFRWFSPPWK